MFNLINVIKAQKLKTVCHLLQMAR